MQINFLFFGLAVITTCCVIQLRWSSVSPSSQRVVSSASRLVLHITQHNYLLLTNNHFITAEFGAFGNVGDFSFFHN